MEHYREVTGIEGELHYRTLTERKRALLQTSERERELYGRAETGRERREREPAEQ
jgi:hypothetical protein